MLTDGQTDGQTHANSGFSAYGESALRTWRALSYVAWERTEYCKSSYTKSTEIIYNKNLGTEGDYYYTGENTEAGDAK